LKEITTARTEGAIMASPTSVLSTDMKKSGLDLKNEGNAHFMKRRFNDALSCYSEGIAVVTQADEDLEATLYSNRSGCYYEMGDYENSAADARKCPQLLMGSMAMKIKEAHDRGESGKDIKMPPLVWKNMYRLARSLHFGDAEDAEVHYPLNLIEQQLEESGEYGPMAAKMREQLNYYLRMPSNNEKFEPSLLRASFQNPYVEYYNFGHDESESLLRRNEGSNAESILLDELDDEELSSLSFLFGGVGDGRHAFATQLDANHQYQSLSETKQDKFRLHMTLNDISAQLLAKDALVLVLSYELGRAADSVKTALTTADSFNIGMVIYYVTLGYAMPPFVHRKMVEHIVHRGLSADFPLACHFR